MIPLAIYTLLLVFVHFIHNFLYAVKNWYDRFIGLINSGFRLHVSDLVLRKRLSRLEKLPVHISLVVVENEISFSDIARVIAWSLTAGIAYITIYDQRGLLVSDCILCFR